METSMEDVRADAALDEFVEFLKGHRAAILDRWRGALEGARSGERALSLSRSDEDLLMGVADALGHSAGEGTASAAIENAKRYGMRRLTEDAPLGSVITELGRLRESILEAWGEHSRGKYGEPEVRVLARVFESVVSAAAERYAAADGTTLRAFDRVANAAFESSSIGDLLQGLLEVMAGASSAVDTGSILLREGDWLVSRAAVGLEEAQRAGTFRIRIGDGIAGRIAAGHGARILDAEQIAAENSNPVLAAKGLRSLYAVPLQAGAQLVGVAHVGSLTVPRFPDHDLRLFDEMCSRATAAVYWQRLRDDSETRVRELEALLDGIPDAVFVADPHGVHHANRAALELVGVDSVDQLNRAGSLAELIMPRNADTGAVLGPDERFFPAALRGERRTREVIVRHVRDGRDVVLRCAAAPVWVGGAIAGAVAVCTDITERKRDDEKRELLYREARQAVADRQHVLGVVAHDLRNALSTVVLAADALQDGDVPEEIRSKGLSVIPRAARRMNRLISDLLDAHSLDAGRLRLSPLPLDPASVVADVVEAYAPEAAARGLALLTDVQDPPPLIRGDRHRLVQAVSNLVANALQVTPHGSITIGLRRGESEAVFSVADTGPGVPEHQRPRIFDPYWRAEDVGYKGTGLGLAIVRGIVEGHGGRVWIEAPPGGGAAFLFTVPSA
jgi:PAS domain S-box-containing protein